MNLYDILHRPAPFEASPSIWTDEHIAKQMLLAHLDENTDAASYRPQRRENIGTFLYDALHLAPESQLLDVGCGPGLYCEWFARKGVCVTGIDFSSNSIQYAQNSATQAKLPIRYLLADYRIPFPQTQFDAAIMVSEDYGVLCPSDRQKLLANIYAALAPGGMFALDVGSMAVWEGLKERAFWYREESGFMRPHPHVVIRQTYLFPEEYAYCDAYTVCDDQIITYYTHLTLYTPERICAELTAAGFGIVGVYGDLDGSVPKEGDRLVAVVAVK